MKSWCEHLMAALLAGITLLVLAQVAMRDVFRQSFAWSDELVRHLFIWCALLGIAATVRRGAHLRLELLTHAVPRLRAPLAWLARIASLVVFLTVLCASLGWLHGQWRSGQTTAALGWPILWVSLAIPVSATLCVWWTLKVRHPGPPRA